MRSRVQQLVRVLRDKQLTLALAESVTCGLASHRLSGCIGTSEVLKGSVVCYTPEVKKKILHVPEDMIARYSCESEQVTKALAKNLAGLIKAHIHAAVTGLASPGGSETKRKPVGTVFFSVRFNHKVFNHSQLFRGTPLAIKKKACEALYAFVLSVVKDA